MRLAEAPAVESPAARGGADGEAKAERRPLGFVQVAFAGHNRTSDLGDRQLAAAALESAFALLKAAGVVRARLLSGFAEGSDLLAAKAWRQVGLGPAHAIFPFLDDRPDPAAAMESATWLDGASTRAVGRSPHLTQTRWLIGAADILVVLWTGRHGRGAGGTADAVRLALEHGIPVLWIRPGADDGLKLIRPEHLDEDFGFTEFLEELQFGREPLVREANAEAVRAALVDLGVDRTRSFEDDEDESPQTADGGVAWPWRSYALFRRVMGGRGQPFEPRPVPPDLARQPGFVRLTRAYETADGMAKRLGAVHRSHQIILLGFAILAAAAGSSSALWPSVKTAMVGLELLLALGALLVWLDSERGRRHHRWGEARKVAEDMRLERAAWTLGVSTVPHGIATTSSHEAREARRLAGLPHGAFDRARVAAWSAWTLDEIVLAQAAYHRDQAKVNGQISHRVHQLENLSFGLLLVILLGYLAAALVVALRGGETPHWLGGVVVMAGAIVPAIGAAGLALEATLSLSEQAQRSRVLASRLASLGEALPPEPELDRVQAVVRAAIRLQRVQEDHWTESASRRRLFRGG